MGEQFNDKIIFYDGDCAFCNKTVYFILKYEKGEEIRFTSIQSDFSADFFSKKGIHVDLSTFYYLKNGKIYSKSSGFLELCKELKQPWSFFVVFKIIPIFIRDFVYLFIAKRRKKIVKNFCFIPNEREAKRFIS